VNLEQFTNCLPTDLHRWVVEKRPKLIVNSAKFGEEYAVLYKPFKVELHNYSKSDEKNNTAKTDKSVHKNWSRGDSQQKFQNKGTTEVNQAVPLTRNWAPDVLCIRCGRGGNSASLCRSGWPNTHQIAAPETKPKVTLLVQQPNSKLKPAIHRVVHEQLAPF